MVEMAVGILAFGSLLDEPGAELEPCIEDRIDGVETPFAVEFARSSFTRDGAPTLVPVTVGGSAVTASVLVLKDIISEERARDLLYRRESWRSGEAVSYRETSADWIRTIELVGVRACLCTALEPNIDPLTVEHLADLAIRSATGVAGTEKRDGISYLEQQKRRGVVTPLMPGYEAEVLARTGGGDLVDAWARARAGRR
jgi:hypothetical protein